MAYTPTYDADDLSPITFDLVATMLVEYVAQASTIVQLIIVLLVVGLISSVFYAITGLFRAFKHRR